MALSPKYTLKANLHAKSGGNLDFCEDDKSLNARLTPFFLVPASVSSRPFVHNQTEALSVWTITHNLGHIADITITDGTGEQVIGNIFHDSVNQTTITFSEPIAGKARAD